VTRDEFEALMDADAWSPQQRARWCDYTPVVDGATLRREMSRPDGMIEVKFVNPPQSVLSWFGLRILLRSRLAA